MAQHRTAPAHITLVEDTPALRHMYESALRQDGYDVTAFARGAEALAHLSAHRPDLLLMDLMLPDMDGMEILETLQQRDFTAPVIAITGHGSLNTAIAAMRGGARDFLIKPFSVERLKQAVASELDKNRAGPATPAMTGPPATGTAQTGSPPRDYGGFIGTSPIMQKVYEQIENAAKSHAAVFITGESGTGKEICAETIHRHSPRAAGAFVPINCGAIPRDLMQSELFGHIKGAFTGAVADREGAARLADGGTLFLDEVGELSLAMQTKLLRFLQNFTFQKVGSDKLETTDVRVICATNRNPVAEVQAGWFREDLFYRLHVLPLYMPPLRARGNDILDIALALLRQYAEEEGKLFEGFSAEAETRLMTYGWPGNIRELQNIVRHVTVMHNARLVTARMLPAPVPGAAAEVTPIAGPADPYHSAPPPAAGTPAMPRPLSETAIRPLEDIEREVIESAIAACGGNIPRAAAALGISPSTIYRKKSAWKDSGATDSAADEIPENGENGENGENENTARFAGW